MSMPVKIIIDWNKIEVCKECADKIAKEIAKVVSAQMHGESYNIDLGKILCNECLIHNIEETKAIRFELPPELIRRVEHGKRKKAVD